MVPREVIGQLRGHRAIALNVYVAVAAFADKDGYAFPTQAQLADLLGVTVRTVQRGLDACWEAGVLASGAKTTSRGRKLQSEYWLPFHRTAPDATPLSHPTPRKRQQRRVDEATPLSLRSSTDQGTDHLREAIAIASRVFEAIASRHTSDVAKSLRAFRARIGNAAVACIEAGVDAEDLVEGMVDGIPVDAWIETAEAPGAALAYRLECIAGGKHVMDVFGTRTAG